jgi:hypothetical protein
MELMPIVRVLWRRRILIVLGLLAAIGIGAAVGPGAVSRGGLASARLVLDTPESQLVFADPKAAEELLSRTVLLSHAITTDEARARIAAELSVPVGEVVVADALFDAPAEPTTLPTAAAQAAFTRPEPYSIVVRNDDFLPIITLEAHAPDRAAAGRLIEAAKHVLLSPGPVAQPNWLRRLVVESFLATRTKEVVDDPGYVTAVGAGLASLSAWCAGVLLAPRRRSDGRGPLAATA